MTEKSVYIMVIGSMPRSFKKLLMMPLSAKKVHPGIGASSILIHMGMVTIRISISWALSAKPGNEMPGG